MHRLGISRRTSGERRWSWRPTALFAALLDVWGFVVVGVVAGCAEPAASRAEAAADYSFTARRLTRIELLNTTKVAFGLVDDDLADVALPADGTRRGFVDNRSTPTTPLAFDQYAALASRIAERVALDRWVDCETTQADRACAQRFVQARGRVAFRRPVAVDEQEALLSVFDAVRIARGSEAGLRALVEAMAQSPSYIYHLALGDAEAPDRLDRYALAARLSYTLLQAPPDETLLAAAERGDLHSPAGLAAQVSTLLADPRASAGVTQFVRQWLDLASPAELAKDPARYPVYSEGLAASMLEETDRFVDFVIRRGDGTLDTLLTASFSIVPAALRPIYGLYDSGGSEAEIVALDPEQRAGLLTHPSLLASHARFSDSSPVLRGVFLYRRVLCGALGDPPLGIDTSLDPADPGTPQSTAERLARHREDPACAGCHDAIDPLGLAFEHYGALGEWRDDDDGLVIPPPLPLNGTDVDGPVDSAVALAKRLASSVMVQDCVVKQWLDFTGADLSAEDRDRLRDRFQQTGHSLRDLILATLTAPTFGARPRR